ncbi:uncharacterized protein LOC115760779 [Drosophila novamexicana]|uniref:uncharacterized protein LOC115760779 n=1 Tax=Drosophila novamexicana TaxID=47314 RepID=UPI0011E58A5B|nr:uncharacterized protein LOC115760779 [Drosophila novamexicana]
MAQPLGFIIVLHLWLFFTPIQARLKINGLSCGAPQTDMISLEQCRIKAVNRNLYLMNMRYKVIKTITELKVHYKFFKRERGGWHPWLYDTNADICDFFKNRKRFLLLNEIFKRLNGYTTLNHTCPYMANTEIQVLDWSVPDNVLKPFPVDHGEYALHTTWYHNKKILCQVNGSVVYSD